MSLRAAIVASLTPAVGAGRVFADGAPDDAPWPHAVVRIDPSTDPALRGDRQTMAWRRTVTVELHEPLGATDALARDVRQALDTLRPAGFLSASVTSTSRDVDGEQDHILSVFTVATVELA